MFTGIIEATGTVKHVQSEGTNKIFEIECPFTHELKVDQSVSHNGVCLTVTAIRDSLYSVTVVEESLKRSNLGSLTTGSIVNLERCMVAGARLDGHIVQGHVDCTGIINSIDDHNGSWMIKVSYDDTATLFTVPKGSICINGVSLTVVEVNKNEFSIAIIPYTWEHTTFHLLKEGETVNLEFDIIGKYVTGYLERQKNIS